MNSESFKLETHSDYLFSNILEFLNIKFSKRTKFLIIIFILKFLSADSYLNSNEVNFEIRNN